MIVGSTPATPTIRKAVVSKGKHQKSLEITALFQCLKNGLKSIF